MACPLLVQAYAYSANRQGVAEHSPDRSVRRSIAVDLAILERYDDIHRDLELDLMRQAKQHDPQAFRLPRSIPGAGKVLALTILYELHNVHRFDRVQEFASYALHRRPKQSQATEPRPALGALRRGTAAGAAVGREKTAP